MRDGYRLSAGVSVRQPLSDRINVFAALAHNRRYANSAVFDTRDNSLRVNFDYALSDTGTLYLGTEYRRGDIVSTSRPSLENVSIAKVLAQDDAFAGGQLVSYRLDGRTVLWEAGIRSISHGGTFARPLVCGPPLSPHRAATRPTSCRPFTCCVSSYSPFPSS